MLRYSPLLNTTDVYSYGQAQAKLKATLEKVLNETASKENVKTNKSIQQQKDSVVRSLKGESQCV